MNVNENSHSIVGFGQNRKHLISALMSISNEFADMKVTIIDKKRS